MYVNNLIEVKLASFSLVLSAQFHCVYSLFCFRQDSLLDQVYVECFIKVRVASFF